MWSEARFWGDPARKNALHLPELAALRKGAEIDLAAEFRRFQNENAKYQQDIKILNAIRYFDDDMLLYTAGILAHCETTLNLLQSSNILILQIC